MCAPSVRELTLLELKLKCLEPINKLPHFHGPHWSALFRHALKPYLTHSLSDARIWIHPLETGVSSYEKDESIHLCLTFPRRVNDAVSNMLRDFNKITVPGGHFQPAVTISLEEIYCRIQRKPLNPNKPLTPNQCAYLNNNAIENEINALSEKETLTIWFYTPLRLPRPQGLKQQGHHYCDASFFAAKQFDPNLPVRHILNSVRGSDTLPLTEESAANNTSDANYMRNNLSCDNLTITDSALHWIDTSYGEHRKKTIGGIVGKIIIKGKPSIETSKILALGQYTGVGKNPAFGYGFYTIPELNNVRSIMPLSKGKSLLHRTFTTANLDSSLKTLPNSSPGPDTITTDDLKKAGDQFLDKLKNNIVNGNYKQGKTKQYRIPKNDDTFRYIYVLNTTDRLVHKTIADYISPIVDNIISNSAYAYRRGLNTKGAANALNNALKEGYTSGIKADISEFFDSINISALSMMIDSLFPFEPLADFINGILENNTRDGIKGILQGSPLSPLLSNLYLTRFDSDMESKGFFKLIRYADDFVLLLKTASSYEETIKHVEDSLSTLGLKLKPEKTTEITQGKAINFLGYVITDETIAKPDKPNNDNNEQWTPLFNEDWVTGNPVYLTSICTAAYSNGPSLIIKTDDDNEDITWNSISRIVIIGRSPFSGGVVYRALREDIPITFIDIMGRPTGHFHPENKEYPELLALQKQYAANENNCLTFAKEIVSAKIHNCDVLLRRNSIKSDELESILYKINDASNLDVLRGLEGSAAKIYFNELSNLVLPFEFKRRVYHPPDGPVNVMLSLGYTLLYNRIAVALKDKGFEPKQGFFHKPRGSHAALASDLVEELRHIAERITLAVIHNKEIIKSNFRVFEKKGIEIARLNGDGFRKFIRRFETTMATKTSYSAHKAITYNAYIDEMADNLKRSLMLNINYKALRIH
ncbi:CRISPR-associated protein Cas1 [Candidatus Magnetoovum chiemensis]|nr:CRISPR-associated protein Cas1 [Candidatus Magnetoovum chiemensis]